MISLAALRQSAAELVAFAVTELFPGAILADSKISEFDFHYDVIAEQPIDENAICLIEEKVRSLIKENRQVRLLEMMRENAIMLFEHKGQPLKAQLVHEAQENIVSIFQIDDFYDFCPAPYISTTGEVTAFKILNIERATWYFSGEESEVVRIRGTAFFDKKLLKNHIKSLHAAKKVDHRLIGKEMGLFEPMDETSAAAWVWLPNGAKLHKVLYDFWQEAHSKQHFSFIISPHLIKASLIEANQVAIDEEICRIKGIDYSTPFSLTPSHALYCQKKLHSYRQLPIRLAECSNIYLPGAEGKLWGILNSSLVYSDTAHIFCSSEDLEAEIISSLQFIDKFIKMFGFEHYWCLCGQQQNSKASNAWKKGQNAFINAFKATGITFDCEKDTGHSLYARAHIVDSTGREWEGPCLSLHLECPKQFGLHYQGIDKKMHVPMVLKRTLFGSFERFTAVLVEHFAGHLPAWLAPEQVRVIPVLEKNIAYADAYFKRIEECGYRTTIDRSNEQLRSKIQSAQNEKIPYLLIIGDKEEKQGSITVRSSDLEMAEAQMTIDIFLTQLRDEVQSKALPRKTKTLSKE